MHGTFFLATPHTFTCSHGVPWFQAIQVGPKPFLRIVFTAWPPEEHDDCAATSPHQPPVPTSHQPPAPTSSLIDDTDDDGAEIIIPALDQTKMSFFPIGGRRRDGTHGGESSRLCSK